MKTLMILARIFFGDPAGDQPFCTAEIACGQGGCVARVSESCAMTREQCLATSSVELKLDGVHYGYPVLGCSPDAREADFDSDMFGPGEDFREHSTMRVRHEAYR